MRRDSRGRSKGACKEGATDEEMGLEGKEQTAKRTGKERADGQGKSDQDIMLQPFHSIKRSATVYQIVIYPSTTTPLRPLDLITTRPPVSIHHPSYDSHLIRFCQPHMIYIQSYYRTILP